MGSCDEILELISAALDGPLSESDQAALDAHLAVCSACSALFQDLSALHDAASQPEEILAPESFAAGVMARISADPAQAQPDNVIPFPQKARRSLWKRWTATAAVVAVVALGAIALPGQLGAATSADTMGAMPQAARDAAEPVSDSAQCEGTAPETAVFSAEDKEAEPQHADLAQSNSESDKNFDMSDALKVEPGQDQTFSTARGSFRALLIFSRAEQPDGLEQYESFTEDGVQYYLIPAEEFYVLAQGWGVTPDEMDPNGEYGLVCITES